MIVVVIVRVISIDKRGDRSSFLDHSAITLNANAFSPSLRQANWYGALHERSALTAPFRIGTFQ